MSIKNIFLATILSTTTLASITAHADEVFKESSNFYLQLNGGVSSGLAPKGDYGTEKAGTSSMYGAEAGYQFNEELRMSVSLDDRSKYSFSQSETSTLQNLGVTTTNITNTTYKTRSLVGMVNFYYDITRVKNFTPYAVLGAGFSRNQTSGSATSTISGVSGSSSHSIPKHTEGNFAYKAGLGAKYEISENIALNAQYQFVNLGIIKTGTNEDYPKAQKGKLRAHEFLAGIAYKF